MGGYLNTKFLQASIVIFCGSTAWFVSDLFRNPEDRFSHKGASYLCCLLHSQAVTIETMESNLENLMNFHGSSVSVKTTMVYHMVLCLTMVDHG